MSASLPFKSAHFESIQAAGLAIRNRECSIESLVDHSIRRIRELDDHIRAWVLVDESGAREQAVRLQQMLERGIVLGPLHGIPIGIKDIIDVEGLATEAGATRRQGSMADSDAEFVRRLRAAGAVILGKTVTTELACFDPPPTRNPWNADHTPGGSSSGSAAATSAKMCFAAIGSQTGGSITRPATYCGVCGWKPTFGTMPMTGVVPVSFHLDHLGPIANSVADLSEFAEVFVGARRQSSRLTPPRIGLLRDFFFDQCDADTRQHMDTVVERLRGHGAKVEAVNLPLGFAQVHTMHRRIMAVEAAYAHQVDFTQHRSEFGSAVASLIEEGLRIPKTEYIEALHHRHQFQFSASDVAEQWDVLLTPATPAAAPRDLTTTGDPSFNSPWSYCGLPTVSMPCGLDQNQMPIGLQLIGQKGLDLDLLETAIWCESRVPLASRP